MTKKILIGGQPRCGKVALQQAALKILKEGINRKCECGAILPSYPYYSETHEIYTCPACGKTYRITRAGIIR